MPEASFLDYFYSAVDAEGGGNHPFGPLGWMSVPRATLLSGPGNQTTTMASDGAARELATRRGAR